jgi:hypothetical protein
MRSGAEIPRINKPRRRTFATDLEIKILDALSP